MPATGAPPVSLVPLEVAHVEALHWLLDDPLVCVPLNLGYPYPRDAFVRAVTARVAERAAGKGCSFAILLGETPIGGCGIHSITEDATSAEIAFWLGLHHQGYGYAHQAVASLIEIGFTELRLREIRALCLAGNRRALATLGRLRFIEVGVEVQKRVSFAAPVTVRCLALKGDE